MILDTLLFGVLRTIISMIRLLSDSWTRRRRGPSERLRHVLTVKKEVAARLPAILSQTNGDAIIRELRRKDTYPDIDNSLRGISPWFKVELKGTYYRGVEFFLSVQSVLIDGGIARPASNPDDPAAQNVFVVGRVPYSAIEAIDWEGDEFYGFTHFYCRFRVFGRGPYESMALYNVQARDLGSGRKYYERLEEVRWKPKRRTIVTRWRDRRALVKMDRDPLG